MIGEAEAHVGARLEQRTSAKECVDTCVSVIRPDQMIISSDWLTNLRCGIILGHKKDDDESRR